MDLETFRRDRRTALAVVRALEVIGEAARNVPADVRKQYSDVPWSKAISMRNVVVHGYFGVDLEVIWKTVKEDLPSLRVAVARFIADLEGREKGR